MTEAESNSKIDKIWGGFVKDKNFNTTYLIFNLSVHPLFGEAINCFKTPRVSCSGYSM